MWAKKTLVWTVKKILGNQKMMNIKIEKQEKKISCSVLLSGEEKPVDISIGYELMETSNSFQIKICQIKVSRGWMDFIAAKIFRGKVFDLPPQIKEYVDILK